MTIKIHRYTVNVKGVFSVFEQFESSVQRSRAFAPGPHNAAMETPPKTDIAAALNRVLLTRKERLRSKNHWAGLAKIPTTTVLDAFKGSNSTIDTLTKLAEGAGMTLAELLAHGDPDWEVQVKIRNTFRSWTIEDVDGLIRLLERRSGPRDSDAS
jgi:hypothetical protein